jgi:hypothetical protein
MNRAEMAVAFGAGVASPGQLDNWEGEANFSLSWGT